MNFTLLILGILLIFVLYLLYRYLYIKPSDIVGSKIYLKDSPSSQTLPKPTATRYSYCLWIYPVSLQANRSDTIFAINPNFLLEITNTGALQYTMTLNGSTQKTNIITPHFPLQKWNYVIISVDNTVVDTYLDGKLVQSSQLSANPAVSSRTISFGNGDIYLSNFQVLPNPMDPQTAWSTYVAGNGTNSLTSYGAYVELTKDSVDMQKYTLF